MIFYSSWVLTVSNHIKPTKNYGLTETAKSADKYANQRRDSLTTGGECMKSQGWRRNSGVKNVDVNAKKRQSWRIMGKYVVERWQARVIEWNVCVGKNTRKHISGSTEILARHGRNSRWWKSSDLRRQGCNVWVVEETCEKITWPGTDEKHVLWEERQVPNGGDKPIKIKMTRVGS